ncbi:copper amine oxidase family protein [Paenibacillus sp. FSL R7-269]|uniref:stalk domain-containing protein n=1 Tax=Paenibacillus sp. FSL R7-269 TaxID=1226755 RepID=UPI0003E1D563|nr:hypothetical protein [Paenibacillus sp. FSL R7-269]ETT56794.1 copper amine oxidase family protein [Paenibacillus sp. FSL R7-269]
MLKWNRDKIKGFAMGAVTVALFGSLIGTAFASGKLTTISVVQGGIKLFVDGNLVKPTDAAGKAVEPFIYDGTTYLPLRALSNALTNNQKAVKWDADSSSIYVGQEPTAAQTDIADIAPYGQNGSVLKSGDAGIGFALLDLKISPFNRLASGLVYSDDATYTYMLKSKYSQLNAQFVIPYTTLGAKEEAKVSFYNVDKNGTETLIKEVSTKTADDIMSVTVNLTGVEIFKIRFVGRSAFYNVLLSSL